MRIALICEILSCVIFSSVKKSDVMILLDANHYFGCGKSLFLLCKIQVLCQKFVLCGKIKSSGYACNPKNCMQFAKYTFCNENTDFRERESVFYIAKIYIFAQCIQTSNAFDSVYKHIKRIGCECGGCVQSAMASMNAMSACIA